MVLRPESELRQVHGLSQDQMELIKAYVQGAVYSWVKNRKDEWFAVRDLVGGENTDWQGTPLQALYEKHVADGKGGDAAVEAAGKDIGWTTKTVLAEDKRTYDVDSSGYVNRYKWVGGEP